jgi:hypothetical protein
MNHRFLVVLGILTSGTVRAQTSPQVLSDSLYKMAVNPAEHADESYVLLLDEGVYRIESDGRTRNTTRQVIQILKPQAAEFFRERRLSWSPERQRMTVNWMRVVKPGGEVISDHPEQSQDSDVPAAMGTPTYTATKVRRISLSGLEAGTILDFSYTVESDKPMMSGDFYVPWRVTTPAYVVRSNLAVDVPAELHPIIVERNALFKRVERTANGRTTYSWSTSNVPRLKTEAFTPDTVPQGMTISVSPPITWTSIGQWYVPIAKEAYAITPSVEEKIASIVKGATTLDDSVKKLHKWVAQDIRYVAIELGQGGYVPRSAETVVRTGFGDCKDKAMLFVAALRKIGVTGYPVLLNISGSEQKATPSLTQFNHMIAAVKRGNDLVFADMTAGNYPLGKLPRSEQGNLAILVKESGADEIRLPESSLPESTAETHIIGKLSEDGNFSGTIEESDAGDLEATVRSIFQTPLDSARRRSLGRAIARTAFENPETDSLVAFDGKDLDAPVKLWARIAKAKMLSRVGDVSLLTNPIRPESYQARLLEVLERETDRKLPYEAAKFVAPARMHLDVRITLPAGWVATLPKSEVIDGPLGRYETRYLQVGDELRLERTITGARQMIPASRRSEIMEQLRKMSSDDNKLIVIKAPPHSVAGMSGGESARRFAL